MHRLYYVINSLFLIPNILSEFPQPPLEHIIVSNGNLETVMLIALFQYFLVFGKWRFCEVKTSGSRYREAQADFVTVAEAEMTVVLVGLKVEIFRTFKTKRRDFRLADAVQGKQAVVGKALVAANQINACSLLGNRQRHNGRFVAFARLIFVFDFEQFVLEQGSADRIKNLLFYFSRNERLARWHGTNLVQLLIFRLLFCSADHSVRLFEKRLH